MEIGGLNTEGVFRVSGPKSKMDAHEAAVVKAIFHHEPLPTTDDALCVSKLLMRFIRRLSTRLLDDVPLATLKTVQVATLLSKHTVGSTRTLFLWILDRMLDVARNSEVNRMTDTALSVGQCLSPLPPPVRGRATQNTSNIRSIH